jgi:erythromycin esterase-like protein
MTDPTSRTHLRRSTVAVLLVLVAALSTLVAAPASGHDRPIAAWVTRHAIPLDTVDPTKPLDGLRSLRAHIGDARIVGLGESVHGAAEEIALEHRTLRLLVERLGFRSVAWEEDWTTGLDIDRYINGGDAELDALVREMSPQWQSREVADVLAWLRAFNAKRDDGDKVHYVGVEYYFTRQAAYDAVEAYITDVAPERLGELRAELDPLRPTSADKFEHVQWYMSVADKQPYIDHAHRVYDLVAEVAARHCGTAGRLAVHNARQIVSFYEHYSLPFNDSLVYRDRHAAENLRWWHRITGGKVAYWAASPHTAVAPRLRIGIPPDPDMRFPSAGSYLRRWYGDRYLSVGFTFDHGTVSLGAGQTVALPPPSSTWFEAPLGAVAGDRFALDLRTVAPRPVRRWLHGPIETRGLSDHGPESLMTGGSLAQWFDVIVHRQTVTPTHDITA